MTNPRASLATLAAFASLAFASTAHGGTKVKESWADSQFGKMKFKNVLAIVATKDASLRRTAEDEICRCLHLISRQPTIAEVDCQKSLLCGDGYWFFFFFLNRAFLKL